MGNFKRMDLKPRIKAPWNPIQQNPYALNPNLNRNNRHSDLSACEAQRGLMLLKLFKIPYRTKVLLPQMPSLLGLSASTILHVCKRLSMALHAFDSRKRLSQLCDNSAEGGKLNRITVPRARKREKRRRHEWACASPKARSLTRT